MDTILSLCSGIGGLDLGLHAGLRMVGGVPRTVCYVEREAFACACLGKAIEEGRLDDAPVWCGDLRIMPLDLLPRIDYITGGYPCQPFSAAGRRQGKKDPRHLWPSVFQCVEALRPKGVFFENVAGHISLGLWDVLSDLEASGYRTAWGCYSASSVGAPHRRERVFILGLADANRHSKPDRAEHAEAPRMPSILADPGLHDEAPRGERALASEGCGAGHGEGGSGCDAGPRHRTAAGQASRVADADDPRPQRWLSDVRRSHEWPSRPGCAQGSDEPPRTIEPRLGGNAHGLPSRVDRLRALGNAVVPQQAELAFLDLWRQLTDEHR